MTNDFVSFPLTLIQSEGQVAVETLVALKPEE